MATKETKKHLTAVEDEIIEGKKLIKETKREVRKARTPVERDNKLRNLDTIQVGVWGLKKQRQTLEDIQVEKAPASRKSKKRRSKTHAASARRS